VAKIQRCKCGAEAPSVDPVPFGWMKIHAQIGTWGLNEKRQPIFTKTAIDLVVCGPCGEELAGPMVADALGSTR
jgi:hypothetical protein